MLPAYQHQKRSLRGMVGTHGLSVNKENQAGQSYIPKVQNTLPKTIEHADFHLATDDSRNYLIRQAAGSAAENEENKIKKLKTKIFWI